MGLEMEFGDREKLEDTLQTLRKRRTVDLGVGSDRADSGDGPGCLLEGSRPSNRPRLEVLSTRSKNSTRTKRNSSARKLNAVSPEGVRSANAFDLSLMGRLASSRMISEKNRFPSNRSGTKIAASKNSPKKPLTKTKHGIPSWSQASKLISHSKKSHEAVGHKHNSRLAHNIEKKLNIPINRL